MTGQTDRKWRTATGADLKRMCPQQRARHLAYAEPSKEAKGWMAASKQRVRARLAQERTASEKNPQHGLDSKLHQDVLVGQLKADEARNRIRRMRLQYQNPSAQSAVRLELLLSAQERKMNSTDSLDQLQRRRVEEILEDERGLTIIRG
ncbi:protein LKAAEAR1 isoform X2 [Pygocentrus nattereri]|uniref:protein LKAAEAR1 isoform X2 n=1 Tax=Pygocentrus nattereri TaxID=42514 RepID=UPI001890C87D|nr:protein LKAAEAR1 isoform X2 [Pygocentrus nattereri]